MKNMILGGVIAVGLLYAGTAMAAKFGAQFPRADLFGVVAEKPLYKIQDGAVTCYTLEYKGNYALSCVK